MLKTRATVFVALALCACGASPPPPLLLPGAEGIDLSHHNGAVDWDLLEGEAIDFVYLKATEGREWKDPRFQSHWREASRRGFTVGAYHFYLMCKDADAQADNFIQSVEVREGTLPPAIDLEYAENCDPLGTREETLAQLGVFLDRLEAEYGQRPVIYTTRNFYKDWIAGTLDSYPLWMRNLEREPTQDYFIWQYDMRGTMDGINGNVDRNRVSGATNERERKRPPLRKEGR